MAEIPKKVLEICGLDLSFHTAAGTLHAVRGVNLEAFKGKTTAVVGESGSGKSAVMRAVLRLLPSNAQVNCGKIFFHYQNAEGQKESADLLAMDKKWIRRHINGKRIAMVFSNPLASLNPTMTIGKQVMEGMLCHDRLTKAEAWDRAAALLEEAGIEDALRWMKCYPHQLSGGMCQRAVIAAALACGPELLICDEPTAALDVIVRGKIIEMIQHIQKKRGISVIYITHDLGEAARVADEVYVMYAGKIVEKGLTKEVFCDPRHPYTWGLLLSMPDFGSKADRLYTIPGSPPNLLQEKPGDAFSPRNPYALAVDDKAEPPVFFITETHAAATWLLDARAPKVEMPKELKKRIEYMKMHCSR